MIAIRPFFYLQLFVSVLTTTLIWITVGKLEAASFATGAAFAFLNTLFLAIVVGRIFAKKSVALSFILIIFKYLVFGLLLYFLVTGGFLKLAWFVVGLSLLVFAVVGLTVLHLMQLKKERDDSTYGTL